MDESFEDLLSKYKQIQLELECIRKEETMALEPKGPPAAAQIPPHPAAGPDTKPVQVAGPFLEESLQVDVIEKKVFQAFNIRPLRQRLPVSLRLDEKCEEHDEDTGGPAELGGESGQVVPLQAWSRSGPGLVQVCFRCSQGQKCTWLKGSSDNRM